MISQGSGKSPFQIFRDGSRFYKQFDNGSDLLIYPIAENNRAEVRSNFNIDRDEEILVIRDNSFWNTRNQGLVLTDKYIRVIVDKNNITEDNTICWSWDVISKVEYQEFNLYFYDYQGNNSPIGIMYLLKDYSDESVARNIGRQLASLFTQMAKAVEPQADPVDEIIAQMDSLMNEQKYEEVYQNAKELQTCDLGDCQFLAYFYAGNSAMKLGRFEQSIAEFNKELELVDEGSTAYIWAKYLIYSCYHLLGNDNEARKDCLTVMQCATDEERPDGVLVRDDAKADFEAYEVQYSKALLERPYNERKMLMPVKRYTDLHQEHINVIEVQHLPAEMEFPIGHPIANQLYIGHPYLPHKYIPFENYQLELVEDKVREFCSFVQKLGAIEITIECINSNSMDASERGNMSASGNAQYKVMDANGAYKREYSHHLIEELTHSINMHQEFAPNQEPSLQENMVWYNNEPSWKRLYEQRMSGSLLYHEERIETRKSQMVEGNEMSEIKGEVKALFASAGIEWNKSMESQYQLQENAILSIKVKFAPMNQLIGGNLPIEEVIPIPQNIELSPEEKEYIDEFKECIVDGEIGNSERRLLNKLRAKLGIPEERAAELEASLQKPQLTDEEQEYFEAYQDAMEDGVITEKERRLLDKLMKINNISEERAKQIEMYHK